MLKNSKLTPGKIRGEFGVTVEEHTSFSGRRLIVSFRAAFSLLSMESVYLWKPPFPKPRMGRNMCRHRFMEFPPTAGNPAEPTAGEGCYCLWLSCHAFSLILLLECASKCIAVSPPFLPLANIGGLGDNCGIYPEFCRTGKKRAPNLFLQAEHSPMLIHFW